MGGLSFVSVLEIHAVLQELFLQHQEALLSLDLARAQERLEEFERRLRRHIWEEEALLLPVYERSGPIPGGPPILFTGEHKRMTEMLEDFKQALASLARRPEEIKRGVLWLLDRQATFKNLVEHHNQREANLFYPALDRVTSEAERREILSRCGAERP
jgi:hemerythrin-like domain-containing protein